MICNNQMEVLGSCEALQQLSLDLQNEKSLSDNVYHARDLLEPTSRFEGLDSNKAELEGVYEYGFSTANTPPLEWVKDLSEQHPSLTLTLYFMQDYLGVIAKCTFYQGKQVRDLWGPVDRDRETFDESMKNLKELLAVRARTIVDAAET